VTTGRVSFRRILWLPVVCVAPICIVIEPTLRLLGLYAVLVVLVAAMLVILKRGHLRRFFARGFLFTLLGVASVSLAAWGTGVWFSLRPPGHLHPALLLIYRSCNVILQPHYDLYRYTRFASPLIVIVEATLITVVLTLLAAVLGHLRPPKAPPQGPQCGGRRPAGHLRR
jgi:hypothetical protein